jgi:HAMP domain-containing protein
VDYLRPKGYRSISRRYSIFTVIVLLWVVVIALVWDMNQHTLDWRKFVLLTGAVTGVATAISRFSLRVLSRPLELLERGMVQVGQGKLEPIQVSRTGDEIESLGASFNRMIKSGSIRNCLKSESARARRNWSRPCRARWWRLTRRANSSPICPMNCGRP